ncbi:septum site-determining protein MinC [Plectonema cf. radiosum LEGE 06105]|uniref:Probable septum site-determining protein MinC n=1 Tax=Plectonema cf. radiosum LEGE 06105 TaxID=945769 RepID=A0A8J7FKD3_9CYAN|nr:septum site-determining protein MinC [Plectonema radiosum]MBE9215321.1 septum site-determining protein MinC [Plectonema cf. radiosum LEGE 06105]
MTIDSAIPDFNSNDDVSQTDSQVTSSEIEESTVTEVTFISSVNNVYVSSEPVSEQTSIEENSTINPEQEFVWDQTNVEENSHETNNDESASPQIEVEENSAVEQQIDHLDDQLRSIDIPLLENAVAANQKIQVEIRNAKDKLVLILPTISEASVSEYSWSEIWQQMKLRLLAQQRFFNSKINVHVVAHDRLLDSRQLQDIAETLSEMSLQLKSVGTSRRQTAIAAAGAGYSVEQLQPKTAFNFESKTATLPPAEPLYLETTVRSGVEIRHRGSVIILGDVNPGGIVVADGDILIWGRLRGIAHAGAQGNSECTIMALQMEPTQLRIADALARAPEKSPTQIYAEVAYMTAEGIRITKANDFSRLQLARLNQQQN